MGKHAVIYVPGLGDGRVGGRRALIATWRIYGVRPVVHQMNWADKQPFAVKLQSLLQHIDTLANNGYRVSLVGESAGASAAMAAYAARQDVVHRVVCICGKLRNPQTVHPNTYLRNPAFAESMAALPAALVGLGSEKLARVRSIHPLSDPTVPIGDTVIAGAESKTIPTIGHSNGIFLGDTLFSFLVVPFLKRR
ncbi:MAG: hypothetical protein WC498_03730 [Candidatus Saccharimonadales bacterium]